MEDNKISLNFILFLIFSCIYFGLLYLFVKSDAMAGLLTSLFFIIAGTWGLLVRYNIMNFFAMKHDKAANIIMIVLGVIGTIYFAIFD